MIVHVYVFEHVSDMSKQVKCDSLHYCSIELSSAVSL